MALNNKDTGNDDKNKENIDDQIALSEQNSALSAENQEKSRVFALRREQEQSRNEIKNMAKSKAMQAAGKGMQAAAPLIEKGGEAVGRASGSIIGGGIGAIGGAAGGAIVGAAAGGIGAGPGALAGLKTGFAKGVQVGNRVGGSTGKVAGQTTGQAARATGALMEKEGINRQKESARNIAKNFLSQANQMIPGLSAEKLAIKETTKTWLNALWVGVWEDPTLLCLLGLNVYLIFSLVFPQMAQFGEDDILGTPLGGGRIAQAAEKFGLDGKSVSFFARTIEIIIVVFVDVIILVVIILVIYAIYEIYNQFKADQIKTIMKTVINTMTMGMGGNIVDLIK